MPADDEEAGERSPTATRAALERIAVTLGCSVEALVDGGKDPIDAKGASELLTIWAEMDDDEDRENLLEFARKLAVK